MQSPQQVEPLQSSAAAWKCSPEPCADLTKHTAFGVTLVCCLLVLVSNVSTWGIGDQRSHLLALHAILVGA
jgi:hypothetical protein